MLKPIFFAFIQGLVLSVGFSQPMPITDVIKTPYGDVPHTIYVPDVQQHRMNDVKPKVKTRYELEITFKDESVVKTLGNFNIRDSVHNLTIKQNRAKEKLMPVDTRQLIATTETGRRIAGIPADSCWLFIVEKGRINSYAYLPMELPEMIVAIRSGDEGPIVPLNKENLLAIVGNDAKLRRLVEIGNYRKAIQLYNSSR
jgi:hypothetical protein